MKSALEVYLEVKPRFDELDNIIKVNLLTFEQDLIKEIYKSRYPTFFVKIKYPHNTFNLPAYTKRVEEILPTVIPEGFILKSITTTRYNTVCPNELIATITPK